MYCSISGCVRVKRGNWSSLPTWPTEIEDLHQRFQVCSVNAEVAPVSENTFRFIYKKGLHNRDYNS